MTPNSNLVTVKHVYAAFARGNVERILSTLADDVDWASDGSVAPWHGQRIGKEEVARFFRELAATIQMLEFTPIAVAASDHGVFAMVRARFRALASGREATMHLHHYFGLRDGKVEFFRGSEDTAQTAALLDVLEHEHESLSGSRSRARTSASALRPRD